MAIATFAMTAIILVFTEVLPKTLAITHTDRFALTVSALVHLIVSLLAPIVSAVRWMVWRVLNLFGVAGDKDTTARQRLSEGSFIHERACAPGGCLR